MKKIIVVLLAMGIALAFAGDPNTYVEQSFGDIDTLDPTQAYDSASGQVIENIYEGLYGYKGESVTEYDPLLATSYEISEDGMSYTYHLRKGVKFHSGNDFSCKDVEYSIQRTLVTNPPDSGSWILMEPLMGTGGSINDMVGENADDAAYHAAWEKVDNAVVCLDDYTVKFNLTFADPAFFSKMIFYAGDIVDSKFAIEGGEWDGTEATMKDWIGVDLRDFFLQTHMSGTGAYKMLAWEPGIQFAAEKFDDYWGEPAKIQNVVLQQVEENASRIEALKRGDADLVALGKGRADLSKVKGHPGIRIVDAADPDGPDWSSVVVGAVFMAQKIAADENPYIGSGKLDGEGIPSNFFSDKNVRKCMEYAFDPDVYIEAVRQGKGKKLTMALPPSYLGYDDSIPTYSLDLEKAAEYCKAAWGGQLWEKGMKFTLLYNTGNLGRQTAAEILKDGLESLNPKFHVSVKGVQWSDFLGARRAKQLPMSIVGWIPDYADPDNYIHTFYAKGGYYADGSDYSNPEINELDQQARTELDPKVREFLYSQIGRLAYEDAPIIVLPQGVPFRVIREEVKGDYRNPMLSGSWLWKAMWKE